MSGNQEQKHKPNSSGPSKRDPNRDSERLPAAPPLPSKRGKVKSKEAESKTNGASGQSKTKDTGSKSWIDVGGMIAFPLISVAVFWYFVVLAPEAKPKPLTIPFTPAQAKAAQEAFAKSLKNTVIQKNSLGMEFVLIPPGKFTMGSPANEPERGTDEGAVEVTLTSAFWMAKTEVTQRQWQEIMGKMERKSEKHMMEGPDYAVGFVSWNEARTFANKLSLRDGATYRLPTEAEWEWSCRAGTMSRWSFGDNPSDLGKYAWFGSDSADGTTKDETFPHAVGKKMPNVFDLSDMHGNVWEWCDDIKIPKLPGGIDPLVTTGSPDHVIRGGSWSNPPTLTRSACRYQYSPDTSHSNLGFRLVMLKPPASIEKH